MTLIRQSILTPDLKKHVYEGFSKHAIDLTGIDGLSQEPVSFEIQKDKDFVGCIVIQLFWGQLHIKYLFIEESFRGKGFARKLMEHIFEYGKSKGCSFAFVETMNFQAPEFYQKLGFKTELIRHGYEKGTSFYYLKRDL